MDCAVYAKGRPICGVSCATLQSTLSSHGVLIGPSAVTYAVCVVGLSDTRRTNMVDINPVSMH